MGLGLMRRRNNVILQPLNEGPGKVIVVGVKLESRSKELLTWVLMKIANSGDRVIALHIVNPNADVSVLFALMKTFESVLAAYEGFCNLKQVDLKLRICRGSRVRRSLVHEAKVFCATHLVVGASESRITAGSRISVAKYCARNLQRNVPIICVEKGKIMFMRESTGSTKALLGSLEVRSPVRIAAQLVEGGGGKTTPRVSIKTHPRGHGWSVLCCGIPPGVGLSGASSKKSSVVQCLLKISNLQCFTLIYPDKRRSLVSNTGDFLSALDEENDDVMFLKSKRKYCPHSDNMLVEELKDIGHRYSKKCRIFRYKELLLATNHFASGNLIGKGGSSQVYRGSLPGGREIAVKILKASGDALRNFVSEIEFIMSMNHKNIISLIGFCCEKEQLILVLNFLSRGCLEDNLHGTLKSEGLGWKVRYKVALGVAEALNFLHSLSEPIIHRDVKSSNILLSDDFEPQLSDFGLATSASSCSHVDYYDVAGTFGYLAPEYVIYGKLNEEIDIYAFGVVLLELLSGRKPINSNGQENLVMWAKHVLKEKRISDLLDPNMADGYDCDEFNRVAAAAIICTRHSPQARPEMSTVVKLLRGDPETVEWVKQEINSLEESKDQQSEASIKSFINLALLDMEDDATSTESSDQSISVEDYLRGRWKS